MITVKIKLQEGATLPKKANEFASGYDCYAYIIPGSEIYETIRPGENKVISLGFSMEIPVGCEAVIRPRSGLGKIGIASLLGTIDSDYRGIVGANIFNHSFKHIEIKHGMRICQMVIQKLPETELVLVDELSVTERGERGFGSSGV